MSYRGWLIVGLAAWLWVGVGAAMADPASEPTANEAVVDAETQAAESVTTTRPAGRARGRSAAPSSPQIAVFEMRGQIPEKPSSFGWSFDFEAARSLHDWLTRLDKAAKDDRVKAVVLLFDDPAIGWGQMQELRAACQRLRNAQKDVYCYIEEASAGTYLLATAASRICMAPAGGLNVAGLHTESVYLKGLLDKIGVDVITMRSTDSQEWKARHFNAVEPPSEKVLADITKILDSFQARFESIVREGRGSRLNVNGEAPKGGQSPLNGQVFLADEALKLGLIDKIGYAGDAYALAAQLANLSRPQVTRYSRQAGLRDLFASEASAGLNLKALDPMASPRIMMLWRAQ